MAGFTYATLTTAIHNYTEVGTTVLTSTITDQFIDNAETRIMRDVPIDANRASATDNTVANQEHVNVPAGALVVRGIQVADGTSTLTNPIWLEKRDLTFLDEFNGARATGRPKYYAMKGGATGTTNTTSGGAFLSPIPDTTYVYKIHYNARPTGLSASTTTNFISLNFPNGLLYAVLVEAYGYLKGPADMLQLYEQKYKQEVEKFGGEQLGSRRRDDYTDGTIRIPVNSPTP
jgi:hypothetical protein|tara:strand:+ start:15 stop:710 length:696 start_codon:yes stop_codon:yes gene_type:complete